jgi:hypothetical protein
MTSKIASTSTLISYPLTTVKRGERALSCSPFQLTLFTTMINCSVDLKYMALQKGFEKNYTVKPITEMKVETELMWLIKVGILRREVDGQGITDSFRLTPLGRNIIGKWQKDLGEIPSPRWRDHLLNWFNRWFG